MLRGRAGDDYLDGDYQGRGPGAAPGVDELDGGDGTDSCVDGESVVACEGP
ncbi:MAG TPA: hypothetical protein VHJ34_09975 [Actinomycetota bacterium]|nr:hypothetical protein [Actinomycetota bacterium]